MIVPKRFTQLLAALLTATVSVCAQTGDREGEVQSSQIPADKIPPAPPLAPDDALKTFTLQGDFEIQLVAAEPMIVNPVIIRWDAAGRLWVMEMRSFMPNSDGTGEDVPVSQVAILHDDNKDGRMDRKTVFLDSLVMPRAMAFARGGILVCEPPGLYYYPILDGDKPGQRTVVDAEYAPQASAVDGKMNVEHAPNGLMRGLDNWFYNAKSTSRYRYHDDEWKKDATYFKGQWGISQDDYGRLAYNSNSDHFRLEHIPSHYLQRNPFYRGATYSIQPLPNQTVWPGRMTPGVNRAYRPNFLRPDGTMKRFTGASGVEIYRGTHFPPAFLGDAFVSEPSGNLVRRDDVTENNGTIKAVNPYGRSQTEFLVSTDEIFRPVNAHMGPDGAMYVVDMYHGIIQHHAHLTTYLREQAESRGLDKVTQRGRIYRIVHRQRPLDQGPDLAKASTQQLVETLEHANGWYRDTAQRLLVDRAPASAIKALRSLATDGKTHFGRLHALWTLEGLGYLDLELLATVLKKDNNGKVLAAAIRLSEPILRSWEQDDALKAMLPLVQSKNMDVKLQLALTLGEIKHEKAADALVSLASENANTRNLRDAVISGLTGRESQFAQSIMRDKRSAKQTPGLTRLLSDLAACVIAQGDRTNVNRILSEIGRPGVPVWQKIATVKGMTPPKIASTPGLPPVLRKRIRLAEKPKALAELEHLKNADFRNAYDELDEILAWPGKPGVPPEPPVRALTKTELKQFENGRQLYDRTCGNCHRPHGFGMPGLAPPLANSEWVAGPPEHLARIILNGMTGPVTVLGKRYNMNMPGHQTFTDEDVAAVITYIRRAWNHASDPVGAGFVEKVRKKIPANQHAWTAAELLAK
ncbi:MAG: dehydrogenase [Verrucomicrobiales bacterium]|nr:dehydrogenase [Verrucomicrobiales bacterium]|tara:strand:- start:11228 stop:13816 length:2589 start_codon:yes stop_codon:yes gene_type:complete